MGQPATNHLLNRLLAIVGRSFPQYLQYSRPYIPPGRASVKETIDAIVGDQNVMVERLSQKLIDSKTPPRFGEFPIVYTDLHDLDIDYLMRMAVDYQEQDIASIGKIVDELRLAPAAQSLAEEISGMTKGHLDSLLELLPEATANG
ncbi:MAG: hypothetical protein AAGD11_10375 [Planctomycetota bacterium]